MLNELFHWTLLKAPDNSTAEDIKAELLSGLEKMKEQSVDRAVLEVKAHDEQAVGWQNIVNYYPSEGLDRREKNLISKNKGYDAFALVRRAPDLLSLEEKPGFENVYRKPFDKQFSIFSDDYVTDGTFVNEEGFDALSKDLASNGWSGDEIKEKVGDGVLDYHKTTLNLMGKVGVFDNRNENLDDMPENLEKRTIYQMVYS